MHIMNNNVPNISNNNERGNSGNPNANQGLNSGIKRQPSSSGYKLPTISGIGSGIGSGSGNNNNLGMGR